MKLRIVLGVIVVAAVVLLCPSGTDSLDAGHR